MARILVTESIADRGLARLTDAGHAVDVKLGLTPDDLRAEIAGAHAVIIRSETKITADVLEAGTDLVVVGRAGIGLDNVDVETATHRGVMVVNAPQSNVISAAEHALALLLAQARNVPQADSALKAGEWQRTKWTGVELHGKVLGLVGLGRVGALVAQRASAFGMRLVAYDPYVSADRARQMGVELMDLPDMVKAADFLTVHLPRTAETTGLIGKDLLSQAKPGLRVINTSRGGIVDEDALAAAIRDGVIAGAGLDVFVKEPTTESPLFELESVVVTPHLGASTAEAQDKAGDTIAEQVLLALAGEFVPYAVNVSATEASETVRPFLPLAERLGAIFSSLNEGVPNVLEVEYQGQLADYDTRILTLAVLRGLLTAGSEEPVTYVNAPQLATSRGVEVRETTTSATHDYVNLITLRGGEPGPSGRERGAGPSGPERGHSVAGTLFGLRDEARLVMVDDHAVDIPPARHMLVVRNEDRPGMIGLVGTTLGQERVNVSDMDVGVSSSGVAALMVLSTAQRVPVAVLAELRRSPGILDVRAVELEH